jgi:hypothetical protein
MGKMKKAIRALILKWVAKHFGYEIVNQWVYFGYNYHSDRDIIQKCWGDPDKPGMPNHFYGKFCNLYNRYGSNAIMNRFFVELDGNNRLKLYNYFLNNYANERF